VEVDAGEMLPGDRQRISAADPKLQIAPGQQVVSNVLQLEETLEAQ
jgi:hypothetical protein